MLRLIDNLSIDVVVGGIVSYHFFCRIFQVQASMITASLLGIAIWCIYTLDHLIDAKKMEVDTENDRHSFHRSHFQVLAVAVIICIIIAAVLIFYLDTRTLIAGVVLSCMVFLYFISIHLLQWSFVIHKELTIAILYTAGIIVGPISTMTSSVEHIQLLIVFAFFFIVLANVILFAIKDYESDLLKKFSSLATSLTVNRIMLLLNGLLLTSMSLIMVLFQKDLAVAMVLLLMTLVLSFLLYIRSRLNSLYFRLLGDGIFILPLIIL